MKKRISFSKSFSEINILFYLLYIVEGVLMFELYILYHFVQIKTRLRCLLSRKLLSVEAIRFNCDEKTRVVLAEMTLQTLVAWEINPVSFGTNIVLHVESQQWIGNLGGEHCVIKNVFHLNILESSCYSGF